MSIVIPIIFSYLLLRKTKVNFGKNRIIGYLTKELKQDRHCLAYYVIFFIRRFIFIIAIFGFENVFFLQWLTMMLLTLFQLINLIEIQPFVNKQNNRIEILNECYVLLIGIIMICFTDFILDP